MLALVPERGKLQVYSVDADIVMGSRETLVGGVSSPKFSGKVAALTKYCAMQS